MVDLRRERCYAQPDSGTGASSNLKVLTTSLPYWPVITDRRTKELSLSSSIFISLQKKTGHFKRTCRVSSRPPTHDYLMVWGLYTCGERSRRRTE